MMYRRIKPLTKTVANQISAGEVIERPASVVKELLENSLDSGADNIQLMINNAGRSLIQVIDNGSGIHPQDLSLSVQRHSTSKLEKFNDLITLNSLGFRGEALASINAVSKLKIISRYFEQEFAEIFDNNEQTDNKNVLNNASNIGTTVIVNDLFFNVPARLKFLKSSRTEWLYILQIFKGIALTNFQVSLSLHKDNKTILRLSIANNDEEKKLRLQQIISKNFVDNCIYLSERAYNITLSGWISSLSYHRSSIDEQFFFINGRLVQDKFIKQIILKAYTGLLPLGRYPSYVLYLQIDPSEVDINVHPSKQQVKFIQPHWLYNCLITIIGNVLVEKKEDLTKNNTDKLLLTRESSNHTDGSQINYNELNEQKNLSNRKIFSVKKNENNLQKCVTFSTKQAVTFKLLEIYANEFALLSSQNDYSILNIERCWQFMNNYDWHRDLKKNCVQVNELLIEEIILNEITSIYDYCRVLEQIGFKFTIIKQKKMILHKIPTYLIYTDLTLVFTELKRNIEILQSKEQHHIIDIKYMIDFFTKFSFGRLKQQCLPSDILQLLTFIQQKNILSACKSDGIIIPLSLEVIAKLFMYEKQ